MASTKKTAPEAEALTEAPETAPEAEALTEADLVETVPMVRDPEQFPDEPHTADVHPAEVENYAFGGWVAK